MLNPKPVALLLLLAASPAQAAGFALAELSVLAAPVKAALAGDYLQRAEPRRMTLTCPTCPGAPTVDLQLGRQTDGTEQRVRSGQTTIADLERLCRQRSPTCRLTALEARPAVGWITTYPIGSSAGSTAVVILDGDLLTIRSLAADEAVAEANARAVGAAVLPRLLPR